MVKKSSFTPGPWKVGIGKDYRHVLANFHGPIGNEYWSPIAICSSPFNVAETKANTCLMAAAPLILKSLQRLVEYLIESHEDELLNNHYGDESEHDFSCSYCKAIAEAKTAIAQATEV